MRTRASALALALGTALLLLATPAAADVVMPEPDDCPAGTRGATCHGGPYCRAIACTADSDCASGKACRELSLCTGSIGCAGMLPPDADPQDYVQQRIYAPCAADGACAEGTCEAVRVCADPEPTPTPDAGGQPVPGSGGGSDGCAAGSERAVGLGLALLGLLALVALARQRQRVR